MSVPEVTVIVPARDAEGTLPDTLAGLEAQQDAPRFEVIVVDDGSRDRTGSLALASPAVDRVLAGGGRGPAAARNLAAQHARAGKLAFLDADCRPEPGWLAAGADALEEAELVLGQTLPRSDQPRGPFDRTLTVSGRSPLFESANLFVARRVFEQLGGFESWLRPWAGKELGEDVWLGWRAVRAGARIDVCPEALAWHAVLPRSARGFVAERWRLRFFPALARRVPELRTEFFYRRMFLNRRSARFDLAVSALLLARGTRSAVPAAAALPYLREVVRDLREPEGARLAVAQAGADLVGLVAMGVGSVRYRSLLI